MCIKRLYFDESSDFIRTAFLRINIFVRKMYVLSSYVDKMLVAQKVRRRIFFGKQHFHPINIVLER